MKTVLFFNNCSISTKQKFDKIIWLDKSSTSANIIHDFNRQYPNFKVFVDNSLADDIKLKIPHIIFNGFSTMHVKKNRIALFIANDTIAKLFEPIIKNLILNDVEYKVFTPLLTNENAPEMLSLLNIEHAEISLVKLFKFSPDFLLMANDWSGEAILLSYIMSKREIKTICIQESIIDLADKSKMRMRWTDYAFILGVNTIHQIPERNLFFVTGNPRYENLVFLELKGLSKVFINCNFTYGLEEEHREKWLDQITETLDSLNINYLISQHPRDKADLSKYKNVFKSNAGLVHDQMSSCQLVVSRFSSILHESLFLGIPAIYYNPHQEKCGYKFYCDNKILFYSEDKKSLEEQIKALKSNIKKKNISKSLFEDYLILNCNYSNSKKPSKVISDLVNSPIDINIKNKKNKISLLYAAFYYLLQFFYNNYKKIKK